MSLISDFYDYAAGKAWDTNGNRAYISQTQWDYPYGGQCVSLINTYLKWLGYGVIAYGNAKEYWSNRSTNGILKVCNEVSSPKDGDIVISSGSMPEFGHIFIYYKGQAFTQNCCSNPRATLYPLSYQGPVYGYLRPKKLAEDNKKFYMDIVNGLVLSCKVV